MIIDAHDEVRVISIDCHGCSSIIGVNCEEQNERLEQYGSASMDNDQSAGMEVPMKEVLALVVFDSPAIVGPISVGDVVVED